MASLAVAALFGAMNELPTIVNELKQLAADAENPEAFKDKAAALIEDTIKVLNTVKEAL